MSHHQHHHHRRRRLRAPELSVWVVGLQLNRYKPTTSGQIACPGTSHQDLCSSSTSPTSPAFNQCRPRAFARPIERRELIGTMSCARRAMLLLSVMLIICGHVSQCLQPNKPSIGPTNNMFSSTAKKLNQTIVQAYPEMIALKGSQVSIPCNVSHLAAHVVPAPSKPLGVVAPQHTQQSLRSPSSFTSYDAGEQQQQRPQAEPYHSAKVAQDSPQLILWYHGNDISGSPIYTLDGRDLAAPLSGAHDGDASPENQTMRHFVAPDYQHRARIDLSGHPVQLLLDAVDVNDTGTYWCRVDFRWTRTLISMMQLKVHVPPAAVNVWARGEEESVGVGGGESHLKYYLPGSMYHFIVGLTPKEWTNATSITSTTSPRGRRTMDTVMDILEATATRTSSSSGGSGTAHHLPTKSLLAQLISGHNTHELSLLPAYERQRQLRLSSSLWASSRQPPPAPAAASPRHHQRASTTTTPPPTTFVINANEGANLQLNCEVFGGTPRPTIVWLDSDQTVIDRTYQASNWIADSPYVLHYYLMLRDKNNDGRKGNTTTTAAAAAAEQQWSGQLVTNYSLNGPLRPVDDPQLDAQLEHLRWQLTNQQHDGRGGGGVVGQWSGGDPVLVTNVLALSRLHRSLAGANFTCVVNNTRLAPPHRTTFHLDLNLSPSRVTILPPSGSYLSDSLKTEITCRSCGARPTSLITWFLQGDNYTQFSDYDYDGNCTESVLKLHPKWTQDQHELTCMAYNPVVVGGRDYRDLHNTGHFVNHSIVLDIKYVPQIKLLVRNELEMSAVVGRWSGAAINNGSYFRPNADAYRAIAIESDPVYVHAEEGGNLTLDCVLIAKPAVTVVRWLYNQAEIWTRTEGLLVANQSLTIVGANRSHHEGNYRCIAFNAEGKGVSNEIRVIVDYAPHCLERAPPKTIETELGARTQLACELDARPAGNVTFYWTINNQIDANLEPIPAKSDNVRVESGPVTGYAYFTPRTAQDFGVVRCWARNKVGYQARPCVIYVKRVFGADTPKSSSAAVGNSSSVDYHHPPPPTLPHHETQPPPPPPPPAADNSGGSTIEDVLNKELPLLSHQCLLNQAVSTIGLNCSILPDSELENLIMSRALQTGGRRETMTTEPTQTSIVAYQVLLYEITPKTSRRLIERVVRPGLLEKVTEEVDEIERWQTFGVHLDNLTSNTPYKLVLKTWLVRDHRVEPEMEQAWQTKTVGYNLIGNKLELTEDDNSLEESIDEDTNNFGHDHWKLYSIELILLTTLSDTYVGFHNKAGKMSTPNQRPDDKIVPKSLKDNDSLFRPMLLLVSFTWLIGGLALFLVSGYVCLRIKQKVLHKRQEAKEPEVEENNKSSDQDVLKVLNEVMEPSADINQEGHDSTVTCYMNNPAGYTSLTGGSPFRSPADFPLTGMCLLSNVLNNNNNINNNAHNIVHGSNVLNYPGGGSSSTGSYHSSLATNSTLLENGNGSVASSSNADSSSKGVEAFKYSTYETLELNRLLNTVHLIDPTTGQTLNIYTTSGAADASAFGGQQPQHQQQQHPSQTSFELSNTAAFENGSTSGEARGVHVTLCDATTLLATPLLFPTFSTSSSTTSSEPPPPPPTTSTLFIADPKHSDALIPANNYMTLTEEVILENEPQDGQRETITSYSTRV